MSEKPDIEYEIEKATHDMELQQESSYFENFIWRILHLSKDKNTHEQANILFTYLKPNLISRIELTCDIPACNCGKKHAPR